MICYKDQTFCASDCVNLDCFRYLSKENESHADRIGLPVAFADFSNDCPKYKKPRLGRIGAVPTGPDP